MKIDYTITDGKITQLVLTDKTGIDAVALRSISIPQLLRTRKIKLTGVSKTPYLQRTAEALVKNQGKMSETEAVAQELKVTPQVARNYLTQLRKEGIVKWI
jgi:predicted transcriptional regulator